MIEALCKIKSCLARCAIKTTLLLSSRGARPMTSLTISILHPWFNHIIFKIFYVIFREFKHLCVVFLLECSFKIACID